MLTPAPQPIKAPTRASPLVIYALLALVANLGLANTVYVGVTDDRTETFSIASFAINLILIFPVIVASLRSAEVQPFLSTRFLWVYIALFCSLAINFRSNIRLFACFSFVGLVNLVVWRPGFMAEVFIALVRVALPVGFLLTLYVAGLNAEFINPTFNYAKTTGDAIRAPMLNPNILAQVLDVTFLLLTIRFTMASRKWERYLIAPVMVVLANLIFATVSRGALLQLIATLLVGVWSLRDRHPDTPKLVRAGLFAFVVVLPLWVFSGLSGAGLASVIRAEFEDRFMTNRDESVLEARGVTLEAARQIATQPKTILFGRGAGNGSFTGIENIELLDRYEEFGSHNSYLDVVAQYGLPFALTVGMVLLGAARKAWIMIWRTRAGFLVLYLFCAGVHAFFEDYFFFRFGVGCDLVRLSLLAFLVHLSFCNQVERENLIRRLST